jgi:hypothetical protein
MKKFLIFILILILVVLLAIVGLTAYVLTNSKTLLLSQIEKNLGVKARASSVRIALPDSLIVEDLVIGDKITCRRLTISPSLIGFLKGDVILNAIVIEKPVVRIVRNADDTMDYGITLPQKKATQPETTSDEALVLKKTGESKRTNFYVEDIKVIDGRVEFTDNGTAAAETFVGRAVDLQIHMGRVSLLRLGRMNFNAEGRLIGENEDTTARLKSLGWIDFLAKDMDGQLHLTDIDLTAFKAYYMKFFKKELTSGLMLLTAVLKSEKNDLVVDGHIELGKIAFKKEAPAPDATPDLSTIAFESVLATDGKIAFDFTIHTKLDQPKLEGLKLKGDFFQKTVGNILNHPPDMTNQNFKEIGQQFKEIGKQFKAAFKESQGAAS